MGGICGMGMCPLAIFLSKAGNEVLGFDDSPNPEIEKLLTDADVKLTKERNPNFLADKFIITSALKREASKLKNTSVKKFLRRGEALAQICESRKLIAICGSHGKTTTTALISHAISELNLDAGFMIGAIPQKLPPVKYCNDDKFFAAEIDESDATIENFSPQITLALNGDLDHTDTYPDFESLKAMFVRLFKRTKQAVIIPADDAILKEAAIGISAKVIEVKVDKNDFLLADKLMAKAALEEAFGLNINLQIFDSFAGIMRRQEIFKDTKKFTAIADYAHHPTEISAFLLWLDKNYVGKKLIFFQPHRYTRTKRFA